MIKIKS
jgi:hypothetical protein